MSKTVCFIFTSADKLLNGAVSIEQTPSRPAARARFRLPFSSYIE